MKIFEITLLVLLFAGTSAGCISIRDGRSRNRSDNVEIDRLPPKLRPYILFPDQVRAPTVERPGTAERRIDIAFLRRVLPLTYAGYQYTAERGFSWEAMFARLEDSMEGDWHEAIVAALKGIPDGHFAVISKSSENQVLRWSQPSGSSTSGNTADTLFNVSALSENVAHVRLHSLYARDSALWQDFMATAWELRRNNTIVLDLRGNSGGNSGPLLGWLKILTSQEFVGGRYQRLESAWTKVLTINFFTHQITYNIGDAEWQAHCRIWRKRYLEQLANLDEDALEKTTWTDYQEAPLESTRLPPETPASPFGGKLIVYSDQGCASACEIAMKSLRTDPRVKIVGANTAGMAVIGENGEVFLPGSALRLRWGQWLERDLASGSGGYQENVGFEPDLAVNTELSPRELLRVIGEN